MQFRSLYTGLATMHALKLLYRRSPGKTYNGYAVLKNKVEYKTIYICNKTKWHNKTITSGDLIDSTPEK